MESSLSKAPAYCFDLRRALQGPSEDVARRVQRAWEAGLWSKATVEGQIPKPRPTPKIAFRPSCYVVVQAPGVSSLVWVPHHVSSSAWSFDSLTIPSLTP